VTFLREEFQLTNFFPNGLMALGGLTLGFAKKILVVLQFTCANSITRINLHNKTER